ncbi:ThiF family adenylyltransferase [Salipaludibacillus sp. LMS25]|jgi:adenylyltransferase/sulfurtransferase|uniref:ThiF family adenylyltransferase n=1 Tax=Salipaludibacillus sp. LMS25 TaxID=2924031 RepID=UPI0020D11A6F|nr:ThiF family adenylyltransferase [Salipaludibacillus sp. LMS25]UTR14431.1 ThiF family adenylyltransferase [Salipaludibacillus sp. LMS25]
MRENWARYSRQMLFSPIGQAGQEKLSTSKVLIIGMGALGTVIANHLTRAGVGHLVFCDRDYVELSNLQRQMLFDEEDVKQVLPKVVAAEKKLKRMNSDVKIEGHVTDISSSNMEDYLHGVDVVIDGTDNFYTRYLMNDAAFKHTIPYIYGGAVSSRGMGAVFIPGKTVCLRCIFPSFDGTGQTCDTIGVLSPTVDMVASLQALNCLKLLTGNADTIPEKLVTFDLWKNEQISMGMPKPNPTCPTCQLKEYPALGNGEWGQMTTLCGRDTVQIHYTLSHDLTYWEKTLKGISKSTNMTPFLLKVVLHEGERFVLFPDGRTLVQGTEDIGRAKALYTKYLGL